jgi:hypothetical protein
MKHHGDRESHISLFNLDFICLSEDFQEELVNLGNQLSPEQLCKLYILMVVDIRLEGSRYEGLNLSIISGKYENGIKFFFF